MSSGAVMPETVRGNLNNARQVLRLALDLEEGRPRSWAQIMVMVDAMRAADARITAAVLTLHSLMGDAQLAVRSPLVERMQREV